MEKAGGKGSWVENEILDDWKAPPDWGVSTHTKNLSNLYVYFWRWAAWKVFENSRTGGAEPQGADRAGIVSFIAPTGFLSGDGFQRMRQWLRQQCSHIWILHLTPEGHQAPPSQQIFEAMRQPVAIVTAVRRADTNGDEPALIRYHMVPPGTRQAKMSHIQTIREPECGTVWEELPEDTTDSGWRGPFTPRPGGDEWENMQRVDDLLPWSASGVMVGRTWPIAPHRDTLRRRWKKLLAYKTEEEQRKAFVEHKPDRTIGKAISDNLTAKVETRPAIKNEQTTAVKLTAYGYRSFDRQYLIRDKRVINRPNPSLWGAHGDNQTYLRVPALSTDSTRPIIAASKGTIISFSEAIPDMHSLAGSRAGRVHPLWRDPGAEAANITPGLLTKLAQSYERDVAPTDLLAYVAAVVAHPSYTDTFRNELVRATEIRVPLTADPELFAEATEVGRRVLWLHTYGKQYGPSSKPQVNPPDKRPSVSKAIPEQAYELQHDPERCRLIVHGSTSGKAAKGKIKNVSAAVYEYTVANMNVISSWFGYRKHSPAGQHTSTLEEINHAKWQVDFTKQFVDLLNVLTLLTELHPKQHDLLFRILQAGKSGLITSTGLTPQVLPVPDSARLKPPAHTQQQRLPVPNE